MDIRDFCYGREWAGARFRCRLTLPISSLRSGLGLFCVPQQSEITPDDRSVLTKFNLHDNILSVQIYCQPVFDKILAFSVVAFDYSVGGR